MTDGIVIAVVVCILAAVVVYIYKAKRSGKKCIGCPDSGACKAGGCDGCSGCNGNCEQ